MVLDTAALGALIGGLFTTTLFGNPIILGILLMIIILIVVGMSRMGLEGAMAILFGFVFVLTDFLGILDGVFKFVMLGVIGLILGIGIVRALMQN